MTNHCIQMGSDGSRFNVSLAVHKKETALKRQFITDECCFINHSKTVDIETSVAGGHRYHFLCINNYSLETVRSLRVSPCRNKTVDTETSGVGELVTGLVSRCGGICCISGDPSTHDSV